MTSQVDQLLAEISENPDDQQEYMIDELEAQIMDRRQRLANGMPAGITHKQLVEMIVEIDDIAVQAVVLAADIQRLSKQRRDAMDSMQDEFRDRLRQLKLLADTKALQAAKAT